MSVNKANNFNNLNNITCTRDARVVSLLTLNISTSPMKSRYHATARTNKLWISKFQIVVPLAAVPSIKDSPAMNINYLNMNLYYYFLQSCHSVRTTELTTTLCKLLKQSIGRNCVHHSATVKITSSWH